MTVSGILVAPPGTATIAKVMRLAAALLYLACVAVLVVVIRLGVYEYCHGEDRVLAWMWPLFSVELPAVNQ
jgi:hypothetical protein